MILQCCNRRKKHFVIGFIAHFYEFSCGIFVFWLANPIWNRNCHQLEEFYSYFWRKRLKISWASSWSAVKGWLVVTLLDTIIRLGTLKRNQLFHYSSQSFKTYWPLGRFWNWHFWDSVENLTIENFNVSYPHLNLH